MSRITKAQLESLVDSINQATGSPMHAYSKHGGGGKPIKYKANVGNYHLDSAYGGHKLVRMDNESGGIRDVLSTGFVSKRELYQAMQSFLRGLEARTK